MRAKRTLRAPAAAQLAVGALAFAMPATALAVTESSSGSQTRTGTTVTTTAATAVTTMASGRPTPLSSRPHHPLSERMRTALALSDGDPAALVGSPTDIRGRLLPDLAGQRVELQVHEDGRWITASAARTTRSGRFDLRYRVASTGTEAVRAAFAGSSRGLAAVSDAVPVTGMEDAVVSWYDDAGDTACGFHATYGIASRTLPCGTKVRLSYGGRTLVATVDDRGPFVYSRLYDLNQNVAAALGMYGVATVEASV